MNGLAASSDLLYGLEARPPLRETLFVALQHVFAVFVGMSTPPLLIAAARWLRRVEPGFVCHRGASR